MKLTLCSNHEVEVKYLRIEVEPRYWEDSTVNGFDDNPEDPQMPCVVGGVWKPLIDIASGRIVNWKLGVHAHIHYKVCDQGKYFLCDRSGGSLMEAGPYCPNNLVPGEFGDYIIMKVNSSGFICEWPTPITESHFCEFVQIQ